MRYPAHIRIALFTGCTVLVLCMPFINGFPFTYPDTGSYLASAFRGKVPYDRPYWYGVFLRVSSGGGLSLWGPVVVQAALSTFLVLRTLRLFAPARPLPSVAVVALLVGCTGLSWYAGQLVPDIFTGIGLLAMLLLLLDDAGRPLRAFYALLLMLAMLVHGSNLFTFTALGLLVLVAFRSIALARRRTLLLVVLSCWPLLLALNAAVGGRAQLGRGGHVFLVARLIDADILNDWLDKSCPGSTALCAYRDSMPGSTIEFLWRQDSPLYALGGWEAPPDDFQGVLRNVFSDPELLGRFALRCLRDGTRQLVDWELGAGFIGRNMQDPNDPVHYMLRNTMPQDHPAFLASRQVQGDGNERWVRSMDKLFLPVMLVAHLALLLLLAQGRLALPPQWRTAALLVLVALVMNALVCATFSVPADRFSSRVNWVVPLLVLAALLYHWQQRQNARDNAQIQKGA